MCVSPTSVWIADYRGLKDYTDSKNIGGDILSSHLPESESIGF